MPQVYNLREVKMQSRIVCMCIYRFKFKRNSIIFAVVFAREISDQQENIRDIQYWSVRIAVFGKQRFINCDNNVLMT